MVSAFIFLVIMFSTDDISFVWKSLSSFCRLIMKSCSICYLFAVMVALSLFDGLISLSCSSSFNVEVVKSTDSIDLVSCSTVAVVVSDVALFCLLLS